MAIGNPLPRGTPLSIPRRWLQRPEDYAYFIAGSYHLEPLRFARVQRGRRSRGISNIPFVLSARGGDSMDWLTPEGWRNTALNALAMFLPPGGAWLWWGRFAVWMAEQLQEQGVEEATIPAQDVRDWLQAVWQEIRRAPLGSAGPVPPTGS